MKYTLDESVEEFAKRKEQLESKKKKKQIGRVLYSGTGLMAVMLAAAIHLCAGPTIPDQGESSYGSFLLSGQAGSYVIVAILAMALGVLLSLAILYSTGRIMPKEKHHDDGRAD